MAIIYTRDTDNAATALAEVLYAVLDADISEEERKVAGTELPDDTSLNAEYIGELVAILACNPVLFNCLSQFEVKDLALRAGKLIPDLDDFMFDFKEK